MLVYLYNNLFVVSSNVAATSFIVSMFDNQVKTIFYCCWIWSRTYSKYIVKMKQLYEDTRTILRIYFIIRMYTTLYSQISFHHNFARWSDNFFSGRGLIRYLNRLPVSYIFLSSSSYSAFANLAHGNVAGNKTVMLARKHIVGMVSGLNVVLRAFLVNYLILSRSYACSVLDFSHRENARRKMVSYNFIIQPVVYLC